ncbi:hypothetical protein WA171_002416 [Blastocystis sp. BT1]
MGSDLGHDEEEVMKIFSSGSWSKGEKDFLRTILSQRNGTLIMCLLFECMIYHYTNLLYLLWTNHSNLGAQSYYAINGTIFFLGIIQSVGASYLKSKRKQIFVFITFLSLFLTIILFVVFRGSLYVVFVALCASFLFELVTYWVFGMLSKMGILVKLISLTILILSSIIFTVVSNRHGYVSCNSSLSFINHTHYSESCSEYSTFAILSDSLPSFLYPSNWNWFSSHGVSNSLQDTAVIRGNQLIEYSCPNALKQAKLTSVLESEGEIHKWFQSLNDEERATVERVYQRYRRRRVMNTMSYQPLSLNMSLVADIYIYDCKGSQQVVYSPVIHPHKSTFPSISLFVFDRMSRSSFLNGMPLTVSFIQQLKREGYEVFEFSEFYSQPTTTIVSLLSDSRSHLFNSLHQHYGDYRSITAISNACDDWLISKQPGIEVNVENDGQLYFCLRQVNHELKETELTQETLQYVKEVQEVNQMNASGFVTVAYLHTHLPMKPIDQDLAKGLHSMHSQFQQGQLSPILGFVGVKGNNGYSIDFPPTLSKECMNPVFVLCIPSHFTKQHPEIIHFLSENQNHHVDSELIYHTLQDLLNYPSIYTPSSLLRRLSFVFFKHIY